MRIGSARELGLYVQDRRRSLGLTQVQLAKAAHVSRRWLSDLEAGKATAEIGLIMKTLHALDLRLNVEPARKRPGEPDLDQLLSALEADDG